MTSTDGLFSCGCHRDCGSRLLRVELDDQLLLDRDVDLASLGQRVHEDPQPVRDDLEPAGNGRSPWVSRAMTNGVVSSDFGLTSMMSFCDTR